MQHRPTVLVAVVAAVLGLSGLTSILLMQHQPGTVDAVDLRGSEEQARDDREPAVRPDDDDGRIEAADADDDDEPTGDGDDTAGDDRTSGGANTGDGDDTAGDDGSAGDDPTGDDESND